MSHKIVKLYIYRVTHLVRWGGIGNIFAQMAKHLWNHYSAYLEWFIIWWGITVCCCCVFYSSHTTHVNRPHWRVVYLISQIGMAVVRLQTHTRTRIHTLRYTKSKSTLNVSGTPYLYLIDIVCFACSAHIMCVFDIYIWTRHEFRIGLYFHSNIVRKWKVLTQSCAPPLFKPINNSWMALSFAYDSRKLLASIQTHAQWIHSCMMQHQHIDMCD